MKTNKGFPWIRALITLIVITEVLYIPWLQPFEVEEAWAVSDSSSNSMGDHLKVSESHNRDGGKIKIEAHGAKVGIKTPGPSGTGTTVSVSIRKPDKIETEVTYTDSRGRAVKKKYTYVNGGRKNKKRLSKWNRKSTVSFEVKLPKGCKDVTVKTKASYEKSHVASVASGAASVLVKNKSNLKASTYN